MTTEDHERLIDCLLTLPGRFVVSGYAHPLYERLTEAGWGRVDFATACYATGKTRASGLQGKGAALAHQPRVESVWLDPVTARERAPQHTLMDVTA